MKQCIALAALLCLSASGCVTTGLFGPDCGDGCGDACHVATSRRAPRPTLFRTGARPDGRMFGGGACGNGGECGAGGCCVANCFGACNCDGCASGGPCQCLAERVANGFCGPCGVSGLCPHAGGYPEQPAFQPGPPTGQVAYPYYTTRGPRDFLLSNPPSIGP